MAIGDVVSALSSISSGSFLTIQPGAGVEWIIHNIYFNDAIEVHVYDGSNSVRFRTFVDPGIFPWVNFKVTNSRYLRVKAANVTTLIGYDGVIA